MCNVVFFSIFVFFSGLVFLFLGISTLLSRILCSFPRFFLDMVAFWGMRYKIDVSKAIKDKTMVTKESSSKQQLLQDIKTTVLGQHVLPTNHKTIKPIMVKEHVRTFENHNNFYNHHFFAKQCSHPTRAQMQAARAPCPSCR